MYIISFYSKYTLLGYISQIKLKIWLNVADNLAFNSLILQVFESIFLAKVITLKTTEKGVILDYLIILPN